MDPAQFLSQRQSDIFFIKDGWFVNLSSIPVPQNIQDFLQLRENFSLPFHAHSMKYILEFIKHFESNLIRLHLDISSEIRSQAIHFINKYLSFSPPLSSIEHRLLDWFKSTRSFLNDHPNLLLTKTAKGKIQELQFLIMTIT